MGILRTDKISGLETPTPVTGSVVFDGTGDYVTSSAFHISDSWTMEFWFNTSVNNAAQRPMNFSNNLNASNYAYIELGSSGNIKARVAGAAAFGSIDAPPINQWHHTALSYDGSTAYFLLNGKLIASQSVSYSNHSIQVRFGADESNVSANLYTGYISNARIVSGEALYTTDYTVPIHAFEVTDGTNLLCFNNADSAAASQHGRPGAAPPTLTVTGDAAASTFSPGLTRDFTSGTEFRGVTTFDTQGYFVPPSGTTEQRGRGRGLFFGGYAPSPAALRNIIDYITISSQGNAQDFGDLLSTNNGEGGNCASSTRALAGGGQSNSVDITFVTISTTSNATDFGDLLTGRRSLAGASSSTRGVFAGGTTPTMKNEIEYVTIAALGDALDFGDLTVARRNLAPAGSPTRGVFAGGNPGSSPNTDNTIDYITFASTGDATDFGNLSGTYREMGGTSSSTRALFGGGGPGSSQLNTIDYITIATTGNTQDFGDLSLARVGPAGLSNKVRGVFGGGASPTYQNVIDFVEISTTGTAKDFGDLTAARFFYGAASDSHGGLS